MGVKVSNSSNYVGANKQFSTFVGAIAPLAPMLTHYSRDQIPINNKFIG